MSASSSSSSSSPLKTIESVLKLNSKGTKLLQSKRYGKAITAFSSCLTKVKEVISESQQQEQDGDSDLLEEQLFTSSDQLSLFSFSFRFLPASAQASNSLAFLSHNSSNSSSLDHTDDSSSVITASSNSARSQASATTSDATASSSTASTTSPDQDTNSFQSPILIVLDDVPGRRRRRRRQSSTDQNSSKTKKPMVVLSFAILYNLAIAFHLSGIHKAQTNPDQEQRRLCKALKLYQTAYNLIQEHKDHDEHNAYELVGIMETMALLNNMGQVHWLLGHHTEAGACFEEMLGSVVWVTHCGDQRTVFQFDLFFHNAMSHVLQPKQSAAAA